MIDANEIISAAKPEEKSNYKMGVVVELFSNLTAKITFDGENIASEKQYSYLASYIPKVGDRVLLASISETYVILGKIKFNESPDTSGSEFTTIHATGAVDLDSTLNVDGDTNIQGNTTINGITLTTKKIVANGDVDFNYALNVDGTFQHRGSSLGFYNTSARTKQTASKPANNTNAELYAKLNSLIDILKSYGLV